MDGRESLVTNNARAMLSYRQPVVFAVNVTWASEGSPVSVLGRDFSNTSHVLCRTGSTQRASYGTYVSPTHVTCPLGTSRENAADASVPFDLFVSNDDGLRWTSNLRLFGDHTIRWAQGGDKPSAQYPRPKKITIGVLMTREPESAICSTRIAEAVAAVNADLSLLPSTTLAVIERRAENHGSLPENRRLARELVDANIVAMVGPPWSTIVRDISANLTAAMALPMVSYFSSVSSLRETAAFPYFVATCPSSGQIADMVGTLVQHFGWKAVATLSSSDIYSSGQATDVEAVIEARGGTVIHRGRFEYNHGADALAVTAGGDPLAVSAGVLERIKAAARALLASKPAPRVVFVEAESHGLCVAAVEALAAENARITGFRSAGVSLARSDALAGFAVIGGQTVSDALFSTIGSTAVASKSVGASHGVLVQRSVDTTTMYECYDAIQVVAQAAHQALVAEVDSLDPPNVAGRRALMNVLRTSSLEGKAIKSGSGQVRFNIGDNSRHIDTFRVKVFNFRVGAGSATAATPRTMVEVGSVGNRFLPSTGNPVVWPGDVSSTPQDRPASSYPSQVAIVIADRRQAVVDQVRLAAREMNKITAATPRRFQARAEILVVHDEAFIGASAWDYNMPYVTRVQALMTKARTSIGTGGAGVPVVAIIAHGSGRVEALHAGLHTSLAREEVVVLSPEAPSHALSQTSRYPLFVQTDGADSQVFHATTNLMADTGWRAANIVHDSSRSGAADALATMTAAAAKNGIRINILDCSASMPAIEWAQAATFSRILVPLLGLNDGKEKEGGGCTLHSIAANAKASHDDNRRQGGTRQPFQYVLPHLQQAWTLDAANATRHAEVWGGLLDGTIGVSASRFVDKSSTRFAAFESFRSIQASLGLAGASGGGDAPELLAYHDTVQILSEGLHVCLDAFLGMSRAADSGSRASWAMNATELAMCMRQAGSPPNSLMALAGPVSFKGNMKLSTLTVQNVVQKGGAELVDVGDTPGSDTSFPVCPVAIVTPTKYTPARVGPTCSVQATAPSSTTAVPFNESDIEVRWSHSLEDTDVSFLDHYRVLLRTKLDENPLVVFRVAKDQSSTLIRVAAPLERGVPYYVAVVAAYAQVESRESRVSARVCIPTRDTKNTCECSTDEYSTLDQPGVLPAAWQCAPCPKGLSCLGQTWSHLTTTRGTFMFLPQCAHDPGKTLLGGSTANTSAACVAVPRAYPCLDSTSSAVAGSRGAALEFDPFPPAWALSNASLARRLADVACPGGAKLVRSKGEAGGGWDVVDQCAPGYMGALCVACNDGYAHWGKGCEQCPIIRPELIGLMTGVCIGVALLGIAAFVTFKRLSQRPGLETRMLTLFRSKAFTTGGGLSGVKSSFERHAHGSTELALDGLGELLREHRLVAAGDGSPDSEVKQLLNHLDIDSNGTVSWEE